jgi:protein-tyrosine phosphatase
MPDNPLAAYDWPRIRRLMFICHGNICRSPMAESVMAHLLRQAGREDITVASAATSTEELGNPIHPGALAVMRRHGVVPIPHRARQLRQSDADDYDLFLGMDTANIRNTLRLLGQSGEGRCLRLLACAGLQRDIADPWYTGEFDATWDDILLGCQSLLKLLVNS